MSDKAETEIQVWGPGLGLLQEFLLPEVQATLGELCQPLLRTQNI